MHGEALVLANLTRSNVERWLLDLRQGKLGSSYTAETISMRLSAVKTFSKKYIYKHLDMSHRDLLERVERYSPPVRVEEDFPARSWGGCCRALEIATSTPTCATARCWRSTRRAACASPKCCFSN